MNRTLGWIALIICMLLAGSCQSGWRDAAESNPPHGGESAGAVKHVVVCWLKSPGDPTARQRIIDESKAFVGVIPGLLDVTAGTSLPSTRPTVDTSFDVAIVMTFEDEAALRAYDQHPHHRQAVERVLRPLVEKLVIYDFRRH